MPFPFRELARIERQSKFTVRSVEDGILGKQVFYYSQKTKLYRLQTQQRFIGWMRTTKLKLVRTKPVFRSPRQMVRHILYFFTCLCIIIQFPCVSIVTYVFKYIACLFITTLRTCLNATLKYSLLLRTHRLDYYEPTANESLGTRHTEVGHI